MAIGAPWLPAKEYTTVEAAGHEVRASRAPARSTSRSRGSDHEARPRPATTSSAPTRCCAALRERPTVLKRWNDGIDGEVFFQKRVPDSAPEWLQTATVHFPSGRSATELVPVDAAHLVWAIEPRQHRLEPVAGAPRRPRPPRRAARRPRPDARRRRGRGPRGRAVAARGAARARAARLPEDVRLARDPRQRPHRAALGLHGGAPRRARARARGRAPHARPRDDRKWWKEERVGVFLDYNQNARDRTVASPTPCAPVADARVLPAALGRGRRRRAGGPPDRHGARAAARASATRARRSTTSTTRSTPLLDLARRDEEGGLGDAPWPPNFAKQPGEPKRVQPSRARRDS